MQVRAGLGTLLKIESEPGSGQFATIGQRLTLDGPGMSVGVAETTHLDSRAKGKRPTLPDNGDLSGTLLYDPQDPVHKRLFYLIQQPPQANPNWQLVFTDGTIFQFNGVFASFKPTGMEIEGNLEAEFTIAVSDIVAINPA